MPQFDPALFQLLKRGARRGFLVFLREHEWRTSLGALLGVSIMLQLLLLGLIGISAGKSLLVAHSDVRLEIRSDAGRGETQQFFSALQGLPSIESAVFITREQAYAQAEKNDPSLIQFLQKFNIANPFSDTIGVTLKSLDDYPPLSDFISQPQWQKVIDPTFLSTITRQEERMHELLRTTNGGRSLVLVLLLVAGGILLSTIVEMTRLSALRRTREVVVERLVGASPLSILLPFAWEATILLWLSILVSAVILTVFLATLPFLVPALESGGALAPLREAASPLLTWMLPLFLILEFLLAPLLAAGGAWLGMRSTLKFPAVSPDKSV